MTLQSNSWSHAQRNTWPMCFMAHTYISMVIAALLTIAKTRKQSKRPLTEAWIKKIWHLHRMEYYSAIEKNEIMLLGAT